MNKITTMGLGKCHPKKSRFWIYCTLIVCLFGIYLTLFATTQVGRGIELMHLHKTGSPRHVTQQKVVTSSTTNKITSTTTKKLTSTTNFPSKPTFRQSNETSNVSMTNTSTFNVSANNCTRRLPQCVIIGVAKCGTSALLNFLNLHPSIVTTSPYIEPQYFSNLKNLRQGVDAYRNMMPCSSPGQITMEKSPQYLNSANAPKRMQALNKDMKIMVIACNPVKRLVSLLAQSQDIIYNNLTKKNDPRYNRLIKNMQGKNLTLEAFAFNRVSGQVNKNWRYIQEGLYAPKISNYLKFFNRSQMHFVHGEEFIKNPLEELAKVETFLDLKPWYMHQRLSDNPRNGDFRCLNGACMNKSKGRKPPKVDPISLDKLRQYYIPHNEEFYKLINQTFGWNEEFVAP